VSGTELRCDLDWLSPPYVAQVIIWAVVRTPGELAASASVREDQADVDAANNTAALTLTPVAPPAPTTPPAVPPRILGEPVVGRMLTASAPGTWRVCARARCAVVGRGARLLVQRAWIGRTVTVTIGAVTLHTSAVRRRG
jgi:hypothetical protein